MQSEVRLENFEFKLWKIVKYQRNNMLSEARQNIIEKLDRVQNCSLLGLKTRVKEGPGSQATPRSVSTPA